MPELTVVRRNGDVHVILYDVADEALVARHNWYVHPGGATFYAMTNVGYRKDGKGRQTQAGMHQFIGGFAVDHVNHNGLDNRRANLRAASAQQNAVNRLVDRTGKRHSIYKGVTWHCLKNKWYVQIGICGTRVGLGYFTDEREAARTYDRAALARWGEFAALNFPTEMNADV